MYRVDGEVWVSPTRLALALSGGPSSEVQQEVAEGYVIVETNYRVMYCLTRNTLQCLKTGRVNMAQCPACPMTVGALNSCKLISAYTPVEETYVGHSMLLVGVSPAACSTAEALSCCCAGLCLHKVGAASGHLEAVCAG